MYIYNNTCGDNSSCNSGYSLYFPCISTVNRGENTCFDFYIVDNSTKQEVDLREVDDITLNMYGRYNCFFGSYSYPENIKSVQSEKFSELLYDVNFSDSISNVKLYIDIVDEKHELIESFLYDKNLVLDISIEGSVGYFLNNSDNSNLTLIGSDTYSYMFLGWTIEEEDDDCYFENIYDFLITKNKLSYNVCNNLTIRAVYQKRREYRIQMATDNINSSFIIEYMGDKIVLEKGNFVKALEGHDLKISCIPNDIAPYKFVKWSDGYDNPIRIFNVAGDDLIISLKAYCEINNKEVHGFDIDSSTLNIFTSEYPEIIDRLFINSFYIDNVYINNCEIDVLNDIPYIKIKNDGYIQIINIDVVCNLNLSLDNKGGDCNLYIDNYKISSSIVDKNEFIFEFNGGILTLKGDNSCVFGFKIYKENIHDIGRCMLCLSSEDTLKLHPGDITVDGGVIVNGNPYGIQSVKFANVTNVTPLIIKK